MNGDLEPSEYNGEFWEKFNDGAGNGANHSDDEDDGDDE
jgi:hypothetical protein